MRLVLGGLVLAVFALGQVEEMQGVRFIGPRGWRREVLADKTVFARVEERSGGWCQVAVYRAAASGGNAEGDFERDWLELGAKAFRVSATPAVQGLPDKNGWQGRASSAAFAFQGKPAMLLVFTYSGMGRKLSVLSTCNSEGLAAEVVRLVGSLEFGGSESVAGPVGNVAAALGSTRFDDGWVAVAREGWAELTKGGLTVLVHYPDARLDAYQSVLREGDLNAWNALVAPRYNGIRNFEWKTIQSFESISYLRADATEKASGRNVHVVLFKKHSSKGDGRYLEFVAGSRGELEAAFGAYRNEEFGWERYADMQFRNRFPVGAADLLGNWGASDYASLRYHYVSNGGFAGATATSLADLFTFLPGGRYESDHTGASGTVGNQKWSRQVYKGNVSVNGWSMTLTNRFQGETENFQCHFEAVRGGRILVMTDRLGTRMTLVRRR